MSELLGRTLGRYHILETIGRGGMASVYQAADLEENGTVAIKVLEPYLAKDPTFKARFKREAEVLLGLEHPNIVPILDYGEEGDLAYIVMPLMQVGCLRDRLDRGWVDVAEGARIFEQVASALQHAHDAGVIHRDVKPNNILIDEEGNAWLSDFGFAHLSDASLSLTGSAVIGTPAYMAPEQVKGEPVTPKTDQYALGVVLYQMSTGVLPYEADTPMALALKHIAEPLPRPRAINPNLPDSVERVLLRALAKDPERRFDSVADFNQAFQQALQEALDPDTGQLRPGARGAYLATEAMEGEVVDGVPTAEGEEPPQEEGRRRWALALLPLLLLLLACPLIYALGTGSGWLPPFLGGGEVAQANPTLDLVSTLNAFSASSEPRERTAVAATLTAMAASTTPGTPDWAPSPLETQSGETFTPTISPVVSSTPTETTLAGPSSTNIVDPGDSRTPTPIPSRTPTASQMAVPISSATVPPSPTSTPPPSSTPTATQVPTSTPTENSCAKIDLKGYSLDGQQVTWALSNGLSEPIEIKALSLEWPKEAEGLVKVELAGDAIWDKQDKTPPTWIGKGDWKPGESRVIPAGKARKLLFQFDKEPPDGPFKLGIIFDNQCKVSDS